MVHQVVEQIYKLASSGLCSNLNGQMMCDLMLAPPKKVLSLSLSLSRSLSLSPPPSLPLSLSRSLSLSLFLSFSLFLPPSLYSIYI